jgi:hypothetical protein
MNFNPIESGWRQVDDYIQTELFRELTTQGWNKILEHAPFFFNAVLYFQSKSEQNLGPCVLYVPQRN